MFITDHVLAIFFATFERLTSSLPGISTISETAGALLITAIWQGAIVAASLALSLRLASRISAGLRFTLWIAGFLAVAGLPFLPLILRAFAHAAPATAQIVASKPRFSIDAHWSIAICLLWAAVSLYRAIDLATHTLRLRTLWITAAPVEGIAAPAKLRGRRAIQICTTDELDQILLHETEHLRRSDDWTNLLQKLSLILFPLNPVLLWMERKLCLEREMACDEAVIRVTRAPRAYAACLTTLAERGLEYRSQATEALSLGAWQRRPELVHRVHSLLRSKPALGPWGARGLTAALTCGLVLGSVELAHCPQLVAFVPSHPAESAHAARQATRIHSRSAHEILTAWKPSANPERGNHAYMTNLRATVPSNPNPPAYSDAGAAGTPRTATQKLASAPAPRLAQTPRQTLLKAEVPATNPAPEQSWVVFTTWEEVAVSNNPQAAAANPSETPVATPTGQAATPATDQTQQPSQIRVTHMIFRVIPAGFVTSSPTAIRTRDGWLVIQM